MPRIAEDITHRLQNLLSAREQSCTLRTLKASNGIDFCSNDYLSLSRSPELKHAIEALANAPEYAANGSTGSRLLSGNSECTEILEGQVAEFHGAEAALLFSSGYTANVGLLSALLSRHDTVLYDELVHASIRDGIRLGFASAFSFRHNDIADLEKRLLRTQGSVYVVIESLYSMDGDIAPLKEIAALCAEAGAALIVDEAHATGMYGKDGAGLIPDRALCTQVFARTYTFGKALGIHGAAVVGSSLLRNYLINFARSFIYTTAPTPHSLAAIKAAYSMLPSLADERAQVWKLSELFDRRVGELDFPVIDTTVASPIKTLLIPGNSAVATAALFLTKQGFDVRAIRSPTVPVGKERLRICLHAHNTEEEVENFVDGCVSFLKGRT